MTTEDRLFTDLIDEREARAAAARDLFAALLALARRSGADAEGRLRARWTALYPWLEENR